MSHLHPSPLAASPAPVNTSPQEWISLMCSAGRHRAGVVRRSIAWMDREVGRDLFVAEVRRRGFHLLASSNRFIVVCNRDPVQMLF